MLLSFAWLCSHAAAESRGVLCRAWERVWVALESTYEGPAPYRLQRQCEDTHSRVWLVLHQCAESLAAGGRSLRQKSTKGKPTVVPGMLLQAPGRTSDIREVFRSHGNIFMIS
ncbi:hypothetical protein HispidOSU_006295 [Sigmodon hispidus]